MRLCLPLPISLLNNLGSSASAVGVGGNNDVNTIDRLCTLLASQVVVSYTSNGLTRVDLIDSRSFLLNKYVNIGVDVIEVDQLTSLTVNYQHILLSVVKAVVVTIQSSYALDVLRVFSQYLAPHCFADLCALSCLLFQGLCGKSD